MGRTWREPTQTQGEHENSTSKKASWRIQTYDLAVSGPMCHPEMCKLHYMLLLKLYEVAATVLYLQSVHNVTLIVTQG